MHNVLLTYCALPLPGDPDTAFHSIFFKKFIAARVQSFATNEGFTDQPPEAACPKCRQNDSGEQQDGR